MNTREDPFELVGVERDADEFSLLTQRPTATPPETLSVPGPVTAQFHGFDVTDRPLVTNLPDSPGEILVARTTVPLTLDQVGSSVVVLFEQGNRRQPIVIGMVREGGTALNPVRPAAEAVSVHADNEQLVLCAEREIVVRCGEASITLTRAGKVIIKGSYIISRSTGYNKIKGAAVDIN